MAFKLSRYLQVLKIGDDEYLVANGLLGHRQILDTTLFSYLEKFKKGPVAAADLHKLIDEDKNQVELIVSMFANNSFIFDAELEEDDILRSLIKRQYDVQVEESGEDPGLMRPFNKRIVKDSAKSIRAPACFSKLERKTLKVLLIGGCLIHGVDGILQPYARRYGLNIELNSMWPDQDMSKCSDQDVVLFQTGYSGLIEPLWDNFMSIDENDRLERLKIIKESLALTINKLFSQFAKSLVLVQGLSVPVALPMGRSDFRLSLPFEKMIGEINEFIRSLVSRKPNALLINEDQLFSTHGKIGMIDDYLVPYSHHGATFNKQFGSPFPGKTPGESFGTQSAGAIHVIAKEVIDSYLLWSGRGRIKCVVVDLDQTLWPQILGELDGEMSEDVFYQTYQNGVYGGLHQALRILKERGIILATASKNDHAAAMAYWNKLSKRADAEGVKNFLKPDDFVVHKINWQNKSRNIREIAKELEADLSAVLFIDDNPVEREEVASACPEVRILGDDLNRVRLTLLTDPCLQVNVLTEEGKSRTQMVKAQLEREAERIHCVDESDFLRRLNIRVKIKNNLSEAEIVRASELISRTTQFNTSQIKYDPETLRSISKESGTVFVLEAEDKFTKYGLVGVCILDKNEVSTFVMSCRVIGLKVSVPFLVSCLKHAYSNLSGVTGRIVVTDRNGPCRNLFIESGFKDMGTNIFRLESDKDLTKIENTIYNVVFEARTVTSRAS